MVPVFIYWFQFYLILLIFIIWFQFLINVFNLFNGSSFYFMVLIFNLWFKFLINGSNCYLNLRSPDVHCPGGVCPGRASQHCRGSSRLNPAQDQGRVSLLLRHADRWRCRRRQGQGRAQKYRQRKDCAIRDAGLHPGGVI